MTRGVTERLEEITAADKAYFFESYNGLAIVLDRLQSEVEKQQWPSQGTNPCTGRARSLRRYSRRRPDQSKKIHKDRSLQKFQ
jgi:hypothetical protein